MLLRLVTVVLVTAVGWCLAADVINREERLINALLRQDDGFRLARPADDVRASITVKHGISLVQIKSFDAASGDISLLLWQQWQWADARLQWTPRDYGDISTVRLPYRAIWTPDIKLYNSLDIDDRVDTNTLALVQSSGDVLFVQPAVISARCQPAPGCSTGATWTCRLKYGLWSYSVSDVDVQPLRNDIDLSAYVESAAWKVTGDTKVERHAISYSCCPDQLYADVTYEFTVTVQQKN